MALRGVRLIAGVFVAGALVVAAACGDDLASSSADAGADALTFDGERAEPDADRAEPDGAPSDAGADASDATLDASDAATPPPSLVYVTAAGKVFVFAADGSGALVPQPGSPAATGGVKARGLLGNAAGTRLYTGIFTNDGNAGVTSFVLDAGGDIASLQAGSPFATNVRAMPTRMAVNPAGTRLYVAHQGVTPSIAVFALDAAGNIGALRSGSPFGTGTGTASASVNHAGTRLYVTSQEARAVFVFGLDANGDITGLRPGSPFGTGVADSIPLRSVVHTKDRRLYVTDQRADVIVYALDANGDITGQTAYSPLPGPNLSYAITMNAAGTRLYVGDLSNKRIEVYTLDKDSGDVVGSPTSFGVDAGPFDCALDVAQSSLFLIDTNNALLSHVFLNDAGDPESFVTSVFDGGTPLGIFAR